MCVFVCVCRVCLRVFVYVYVNNLNACACMRTYIYCVCMCAYVCLLWIYVCVCIWLCTCVHMEWVNMAPRGKHMQKISHPRPYSSQDIHKKICPTIQKPVAVIISTHHNWLYINKHEYWCFSVHLCASGHWCITFLSLTQTHTSASATSCHAKALPHYFKDILFVLQDRQYFNTEVYNQ